MNDYTYTALSSGSPTSTPTSPTASVITSPPPNSALNGTTVTFTWTAGSGVAERHLAVGTTMGGSSIYAAYQGSATSHTVSGLPTGGAAVYVRLLSCINGTWQVNDYTYAAAP